MKRYLSIALVSIIPCSSMAFASFQEQTDLVVKKYVAITKQAEQEHGQGSTPATISKLERAYASLEAAKIMAGAGSNENVEALAEAFRDQARSALKVHQSGSTKATISRLNKAYGATAVASDVLKAIGISNSKPETVIIYRDSPSQGNEGRDGGGYHGTGEGSGGYGSHF